MKKAIEKLFIDPNAKIENALRTITEAAHFKLPVGIALVVDAENRLIGTVTDGDIRRALSKGADVKTPLSQIMAIEPITVEENLSAEEMVKAILRKVKLSKRIRDYKVDKAIVVNSEKKVVDIYDFYELWYKQEVRLKKIAVIGTGHIGVPLLLTLAETGFDAIGVDKDQNLINQLSRGVVPFYEEGVEPLLRFHLKEGNLRFVSNFDEEDVDVYFICVGTPVDEYSRMPIQDSLIEAARDIGKKIKKDDLVILRSTVPVGTTRKTILPILEQTSSLKAGWDFHLVFAPERVVEGKALEENKSIPQILGGINAESVQAAARIFQKYNSSIIALEKIEEAEMVKLINNSYRDLSFSFANNIARICDSLNLNAVNILKAASEGYPRNAVPMPSPGVGGYCLTKDPFLLAHVAKNAGVDPGLFIQGRTINSEMPAYVANKILRFLDQAWPGEKANKVYILGFAFKGNPETSDMRYSSTLDVLRNLKKAAESRILLSGYDPLVPQNDIESSGVIYERYDEGFRDAHCVLIMNNNKEFAHLDIFRLLETMKKPGMLFDGWHIFSPKEIKRVKGISYQGLGGGY